MKPTDPPRLSADVRRRLAQLLGMVGSNHDNEALTAARLADKLVREIGLTWHDVIAAPRLPPDPTHQPQPSTEDPLYRFATLEACCDFVLANAPMLTDWEEKFIRRLPDFARLSTKQLDILRRLVRRAIDAGGAP